MVKDICAKSGCSVQAWHYNQQDPQYKSYLLLELESPHHARTIRDFLGKNALAIFGDDKCEVGILPDDQQFPQNP